jgi:hypothetical protein
MDSSNLTTAEVLRRVNRKHRMTLIRWRRKLGFPEPVQVGGPTSPNEYDRVEVEAWLTANSRRHTLRPLPEGGKHPDAGAQLPL